MRLLLWPHDPLAIMVLICPGYCNTLLTSLLDTTPHLDQPVRLCLNPNKTRSSSASLPRSLPPHTQYTWSKPEPCLSVPSPPGTPLPGFLICPPAAASASQLSSGHNRCAPALGSLYLLVPLPGAFSSQISACHVPSPPPSLHSNLTFSMSPFLETDLILQTVHRLHPTILFCVSPRLLMKSESVSCSVMSDSL